MEVAIGAIFKLIETARNQAIIAKENIQTCHLLSTRCELLILPLKSLMETNSTATLSHLNNLYGVISKCIQFIDNYGKPGWKLKLNRYFDAGGIKKEFDNLNDQLSQATNDLNLGIHIQTAQCLQENFKALESDTKEIIIFLNELAAIHNMKLAEVPKQPQTNQEKVMDNLITTAHIFSEQNADVLQKSSNLLVLSQENNSDIDTASTVNQNQSLSSPRLDYEAMLRRSLVNWTLLDWNKSTSTLIGTGSFGKVYSCKYEGGEVALKLFKDFHSLTPKEMQNIRREALIMQSCNHDNILEFIAVDLSKGILITQLAYCSLHSVIHDPTVASTSHVSMNSMTQLIWTYQILCGLRFLHFHGIIHRDLKPANVLLAQSQRQGLVNQAQTSFIAKIADFGVSTSVGMTSTRGTKDAAVGTSAYMSPELIDQNVYSNKSDIYAFGIMINEMMIRQVPWIGYRNVQIIRAVVDKEERPSLHVPTTPEEKILVNIVGNTSSGCLHQKPDKRYEAGALCEDLKLQIAALTLPKTKANAIENTRPITFMSKSEKVDPVVVSESEAKTSSKSEEKPLKKSLKTPIEGTIDKMIEYSKTGDIVSLQSLFNTYNCDKIMNSKTANGWTALMYASSKGHKATVRLLLEKGSDVHIKNNNGWTALIYASDNSNDAIMKLLIDNGADVNDKDQDSFTSLMRASRYGHLAIVKSLIDKGVYINMRDSKGKTALMFSCEHNHENIVKLLLEKGAKVNKRNNAGDTALVYANLYNHEAIAKLLTEHGAHGVCVCSLM